MDKATTVFLCKIGAGVLAMAISFVCLAKTPIDLTIDFLAGPRLGGERMFDCKEAVDGKITDEHAIYHFHDGGRYSRLNSHPDPRTGNLNAAEVHGLYRVKIENGMLKVTFKDEELGQTFLDNKTSYDATLIGTDGDSTMAMMMDRPVPRNAGIVDHLRMVCVGGKSFGGGPQRSY